MLHNTAVHEPRHEPAGRLLVSRLGFIPSRFLRIIGSWVDCPTRTRETSNRRGPEPLESPAIDKLETLIRPIREHEHGALLAIINEAAEAYRGVIPEDRWHEPYFSADYLAREIGAGVRFFGCESNGELLGVMGVQDVDDVTLIRHAYVLPQAQRAGTGGRLLRALLGATDRPVLVGTWADAWWAIAFYEKHGFTYVGPEETARLLRRYWDIPERQVETSVVLAQERP